LSSRGIWANAGFNIQENAIGQFSTINEQTGERTYGPRNVDGNHNWFFWLQWHKGGGEKKPGHSFNIEGNGGKNISYINNKRNENNFTRYQLEYEINYSEEDKYMFRISPNIGFNNSISTLNPDQKNKFLSYGGDVEGSYMLPGKIFIESEIDFDLRQKIKIFQANPNIILWKASLSKSFFKEKTLWVRFIANDLLDRNKGFTRIINSDRLEEENFQRLSRYFMLKFEWSFNKLGGK
jgi:hypothetical protein